ncbi:hypothetical protein VPHK391_0041 [Vibrio phage K391]
MSPIGLCALVVYHGFLRGGNYLTPATPAGNNRITIT